ncbi:Na+/H+ antiporter [Terracidiphilus gabretensis]|uniref:Na+/H+ antiporter n=1 Tax=Terracidiphilus gabretensis TaxID=1577687 RepID=UPI00071BB520|nr:Na+/H+ antiporter [Terracidiphilus gabretensis]
MSEIHAVEIAFLLLLCFVVIFGIFARKLSTPYPIVMVLGGLALSFVPGIPHIELNPDLVFLIFLPPLLYSSAWNTSWRDFKANLVTILLLAFGLVVFTVAGVGLLAPFVFPGFDWRLGMLLGAVVAPTDAIAASAIARRIGLPERIVDILEGESLINDATGLLALEFARQIIVQERIPTVSEGLLKLLWLTVGGILVGLAIGWVIEQIERRLEDATIEITLSILAPYVIYLAAEELHASGVLAVVTAGLYLSVKSATFLSPATRLKLWSVWESLTFILNGVVFVLIGLQFPQIRGSIHEYGLGKIILDGALFSLILIALRLAWVLPGSHLAFWFNTRVLNRRLPPPRPREVFVVGWTGMRGVISLAGALALPIVLMDGSPFPYRNAIVLLTFCVIFVTLVLQGLTLPPLVRWLGLSGTDGPNCEELEARRIVAGAALTHLTGARERDNIRNEDLYDDLIDHYQNHLASLDLDNQEATKKHVDYTELSLETLRIERDTAIGLRNEGRINDAVLRRIERELDLSESRLTAYGSED